MQLDITISRDEWAEALDELLPLKVHLDDDPATDRWLWLGSRSSFELVPGVGLRVAAPAEIRWSTAIGDLPLRLHELRVMLRPYVADRGDGGSLVLSLHVEETDFALLPAFVDRGVMKWMNEQLVKHDISWSFARALSRDVQLPKDLDPVSTMSLHTGNGSCVVDAEAIHLRAVVAARFVHVG